jgi:hypothetical protein
MNQYAASQSGHRYPCERTGLRIPLIADTHSKLIADSVPGDRGRPGRGA